LSDYVKVVECCLDAFNEEEAGAIWDEWRRMYFQYRRRMDTVHRRPAVFMNGFFV